jgi:predicted nucleic acid-binding protein
MIYADTSFIVPTRHSVERNHSRAVACLAEYEDEVWIWSPWHRVEVFNTVRQLPRQIGISQAEAGQIIRLLEEDVRCGYFQHMEADWRDVLRAANEISAAHSHARPCRAADLLHVAYAQELSATRFVSFDAEQLALAEVAGFEVICP